MNISVNFPSECHYKRRVLDGFWIKMIGFILTFIDHVGFIFEPQLGETVSTILRCTGRMAFPIFVLLAIEGVYHTHNYWRYFLRLAVMAVVLDAFCYTVHYGFPSVGADLTPGNVFTDLALGTLVVYLFRRNDRWTMMSVFPIAFLVLSDFTVYRQGYGSQFALIPYGIASDYGTFGLTLFILMWLAYESVMKISAKMAERLNLPVEVLMENKLRLWLNIGAVVALFANALIYQVLFSWFGPLFPILPGIGWPIESWSCLAFIFFFLYDGRPGLKNKAARYSLYLFYPVHLIVLWLVSLAF